MLDSPHSIPANAKPWEIIRAMLPEGWDAGLLGNFTPSLRQISGCRVFRVDSHGEELLYDPDAYSVTFERPVDVDEDFDFEAMPSWVLTVCSWRREKWYARHTDASSLREENWRNPSRDVSKLLV